MSAVSSDTIVWSHRNVLYTADLPMDDKVIAATFVDDTDILVVHRNPVKTSTLLAYNRKLLKFKNGLKKGE